MGQNFIWLSCLAIVIAAKLSSGTITFPDRTFSQRMKGMRRTTGILKSLQTSTIGCMTECASIGQCIGINIIKRLDLDDKIYCELTRGPTNQTIYESFSNSTYYERPCEFNLLGSMPCPIGLSGCCYESEYPCVSNDPRPQCNNCAHGTRGTNCNETCSIVILKGFDVPMHDFKEMRQQASISTCMNACWDTPGCAALAVYPHDGTPETVLYGCWMKTDNDRTVPLKDLNWREEYLFCLHCN